MYFNDDGITIYYKKYGESDKVIFILPGWGNTRTTFNNIINFFKDSYTIYIIDYPGFGNSPIPQKDLTIYDYANVIRDFMQEQNIINPIIIAHSFGGRLATILTGYYKEPCDKIIMIDIAGIKPRKTFKALIKEKIYKLLKKLSRFLPKLKQENYLQKLIKVFGSSDYQSLPITMQKTFKNIVNEDLSCYFKYIDSEVLLLWGKLDNVTPLKDGYKINSLVKDSGLVIFPEGNHFSYLQYAYLVNKIILEFIKNS